MIEWIKPRGRGNPRGATTYIGVSVLQSKKNLNRANQLSLRFSSAAAKDLRLIAGDRVVIGLDLISKEICFKRTTDNRGLKISGRPNSNLRVQVCVDLPAFAVQQIDVTDVKIEGTHVAICCPELFKKIVAS